jgi:elongation factor G
MDTFTDGAVNYSLMSMFVPKPVMSLSVKPKDSQLAANFSKAVGKFTREGRNRDYTPVQLYNAFYAV